MPVVRERDNLGIGKEILWSSILAMGSIATLAVWIMASQSRPSLEGLGWFLLMSMGGLAAYVINLMKKMKSGEQGFVVAWFVVTLFISFLLLETIA